MTMTASGASSKPPDRLDQSAPDLRARLSDKGLDLPELGVDQVGIVIRDLAHSLPYYEAALGVGRWSIWTYDEAMMTSSTFRHEPGQFAMRVALAGSSPQIELVEPLQGPSIYHEWLDERGEGLHHIGAVVPSLDAGVEQLEGAGSELMQSGRGYGARGDGGFAYFDTTDALGLILELIEVPAERRDPELVWPEGS